MRPKARHLGDGGRVSFTADIAAVDVADPPSSTLLPDCGLYARGSSCTPVWAAAARTGRSLHDAAKPRHGAYRPWFATSANVPAARIAYAPDRTWAAPRDTLGQHSPSRRARAGEQQEVARERFSEPVLPDERRASQAFAQDARLDGRRASAIP
ncbi:hypothetical protein K523DRAFT_359016, partial [Schizophyllum commune Tattone D]